jgi:hypothetical protein
LPRGYPAISGHLAWDYASCSSVHAMTLSERGATPSLLSLQGGGEAEAAFGLDSVTGSLPVAGTQATYTNKQTSRLPLHRDDR